MPDHGGATDIGELIDAVGDDNVEVVQIVLRYVHALVTRYRMKEVMELKW